MYQSQVKNMKSSALSMTEPNEKMKNESTLKNERMKTDVNRENKSKVNGMKEREPTTLKIKSDGPQQPQRVRSTCC